MWGDRLVVVQISRASQMRQFQAMLRRAHESCARISTIEAPRAGDSRKRSPLFQPMKRDLLCSS